MYTRQLLLAIGAFVKLTVNIIPEKGLYNGARGTVVDWVFSNGKSLRTGNMPILVIVDFPAYSGPPLLSDIPFAKPTWVPLKQMERRCDCRACFRTGFPLKIAKACTIHGLQGLEVGPGLPMERLVGKMTRFDEARNPGMRYVLHSRCKDEERLAMRDPMTLIEYKKL